MRTLFSSLVMAFVLILAASYAWTHMRQVSLVAPSAVSTKDQSTPPTYAEAEEAKKLVTFAGPLADYIAHQQGPSQSPQAGSQVVTIEDAPGQAGCLRSRGRIGRGQQRSDSESDVSRPIDRATGL
jgi:hypothetical protein